MSRNIIRGDRSLYYMILEKCLYECVCVCVSVCVRIPLYLRIYPVDLNRMVLIFVFLFCIGEENNFVWFTHSVFVSFRIFDFRNICFWIFLMIALKFLNRIDSIRKRMKKPKLKKKKISSYHGFFVINKNVFLFKKLITPALNNVFFGEKSW